MGRRLEFQTFLEGVLGSENVYFQPPANVKMNYPCIVYSRDAGDSSFADNASYRYSQRYQVTYIDRNPDRETIIEKIVRLPMCIYRRFYTVDNLNHDVFVLYF